MSKCPTGLAYVGYFINYNFYLPVPSPRGLRIDLEGGSTFLPLMLSMHINRLGLFSHLYRTLLNCLSMCLAAGLVLQRFAGELGGVARYLCQLGVAHTSFLGVNALGIGFVHPSGTKMLFFWVYMAIYSHIYKYLQVYMSI